MLPQNKSPGLTNNAESVIKTTHFKVSGLKQPKKWKCQYDFMVISFKVFPDFLIISRSVTDLINMSYSRKYFKGPLTLLIQTQRTM